MNHDDFKKALFAQGANSTVDLHTADGLTITIRQNYGDAMTVAEIYLDNCYLRNLTLTHNPLIIDIGGFIGDFSLYAVKRLNARKVIVCEPSPQNWPLLLKNIANNCYEDRIVPVNKAVTDGRDAMLNVDAPPNEQQCMVSAYYPSEQSLTAVSGISLGQLLHDHDVDGVDLLKIDCEGGEYLILEETPSNVLSRIKNIVFEYHDVEGGWGKLESAKQRLHREGYELRSGRGLIWASRAA